MFFCTWPRFSLFGRLPCFVWDLVSVSPVVWCPVYGVWRGSTGLQREPASSEEIVGVFCPAANAPERQVRAITHLP